MNYLDFPRFAIYLIPDKSFTETIFNFYNENIEFKYNYNSIIKNGLKLKIKSFFYIDHLNNEKKLISSFLNLKNEIFFSPNINFKKITYEIKFSNGNIILELKKNIDFDFFSKQVLRRYDEFRKVLTPSDYSIDIKRFGKLNENQTLYYQIWGYPYLFEEGKHCINILNSLKDDNENSKFLMSTLANKLKNFDTLDLSKIIICKQNIKDKVLHEIASIEL